MNECWNQFLIQLKYPLEFWLGILLFHQKCLLKTERGGTREFGNGIFPSALALALSVKIPTPWFLWGFAWILVYKVHIKASSAVIVPSTSFTVKACHSRKKENALSVDQVEQMPFNFMKQKQTWKRNNYYSTERLFILVWSSITIPSVFYVHYWLCDLTLDCFLVHSQSSFFPLCVNLFSYLVSKCWPNYSGIILLVKGICSAEVSHVAGERSIC